MAHSLNIQAICDSDRCFTFIGVVAPGKTSDQVGYERTSINKCWCIMALPLGMYVIGNAAYQVSDVMLVPFTGSQLEDQGKMHLTSFFPSNVFVLIWHLACFKPSCVC
jgi:hypothetical protein